jgi:hypothetical protein
MKKTKVGNAFDRVMEGIEESKNYEDFGDTCYLGTTVLGSYATKTQDRVVKLLENQGYKVIDISKEKDRSWIEVTW